jgi:hypothetical protein
MMRSSPAFSRKKEKKKKNLAPSRLPRRALFIVREERVHFFDVGRGQDAVKDLVKGLSSSDVDGADGPLV